MARNENYIYEHSQRLLGLVIIILVLVNFLLLLVLRVNKLSRSILIQSNLFAGVQCLVIPLPSYPEMHPSEVMAVYTYFLDISLDYPLPVLRH